MNKNTNDSAVSSTKGKVENSLGSPHTIITIVMLITFDVIFIGVFYFLFVVKKEKEIITNELENLVESISLELSIIPKEQKDNILKTIQSLEADTASDRQVLDSNKSLFNQTIIVFSIFLILSIIFIITISKIYNINIFPIIISNTVLLFAIFITELLFIYQISSKYIGIDKNLIKKHILIELKK
jgi:hypothetical protein